jgi:trk system potassium uptake protein TrkA
VIGAILRGDRVIMPRGETEIEPKDRVVLFVAPKMFKKVEKLLAVGVSFFD